MIFNCFSKLLNSPKFWGFAFIIWMLTLCILSSFSKTMPDEMPSIPNMDKLLHFGYFFGGGIILTTWSLLKRTPQSKTLNRFLLLLIVFGILGALDEFHQTFTPGRSGNDKFDWLADIIGALSGILFAHRFHSRLRSISYLKCSNSKL